VPATSARRSATKKVLTFFTLIVFISTVISPLASLAASIQTDLWVYQYGDTVTVSGVDFAPGEVVELITTDPNGAGVDSGATNADASGAFTYQFVLLSNVAGIYDVTATGVSSGLVAQTQFDPQTVTIADRNPSSAARPWFRTVAGGFDVTISGSTSCTGSGNGGCASLNSVAVSLFQTDSGNGTVAAANKLGLPGTNGTKLASLGAGGSWSVVFQFRTAPSGTQLGIPADNRFDVQASASFTLNNGSPASATDVSDEHFGVDNTAPTSAITSPTPSLPYSANGNLTISGTATDALSGLATPAITVTLRSSSSTGTVLDTETDNVSGGGAWTVTFTSPPTTPGTYCAVSVAADRAGNLQDPGAAQCWTTAPVDSTPPVIIKTVTGTLGTNGWYTSNVIIDWTVSDGESAFTLTGCADIPVSSETTGFTSSCSATSAGGTASDSVTIKLDKTGPSAALSVTAGTAGSNGWYTSDVTIHTAGADLVSGGVVCTADQTQSAETAGAAFNGSCTNAAGLTTGATPMVVKLDKTGPSANLGVASGTVGSNGWYTSAVTVETTGDDDISSPVTCDAVQAFVDDTTGTVVNGSCTNDAGLTTNAASLTIKIDATGPTAALQVTAGTVGANGWYTSDITITTTGSDPTSEPVTCTAAQVQSSETTGTTFNGSCTNDAGITVHAAPLTVKLDKTAPSANLAVTAGTAGSNGWYTSDVTVDTSGADTISGPVSCTADQFQTTETTGQEFNGSCTNDAGLSTDAAPLTVKLDKTAPVVLVTGVSNGAVYILGSVPVAGCSTTDAMSGVDTLATLTSTGGPVGFVTVNCLGAKDNAGLVNSATATYQVVFNWSGFFKPVDNLPIMNTAKAGSAIPVKFSLAGFQGWSVIATSYPKAVKIGCDSGVPTDVIEETVTAGGSTLNYDPTSDQYIYVWKSDKAWAGSCRQLQVLLSDGTTHVANFMFAK
jgi:hypothetical protein